MKKQEKHKKHLIETKIKLWSGRGLDKKDSIVDIQVYPTFNDKSETIKASVQQWLGTTVWQLSMEQVVQVVMKESPRCIQAQKIRGKVKQWWGEQTNNTNEDNRNDNNNHSNNNNDNNNNNRNNNSNKKNNQRKQMKMSAEDVVESIQNMPANNKKTQIIKQQVKNWIANNTDEESIEDDIESAFKKILLTSANDPKTLKIKNQVMSWLAVDEKSQKIRRQVFKWSGKLNYLPPNPKTNKTKYKNKNTKSKTNKNNNYNNNITNSKYNHTRNHHNKRDNHNMIIVDKCTENDLNSNIEDESMDFEPTAERKFVNKFNHNLLLETDSNNSKEESF